MNVQATSESTMDLTVATQDGVDMEWNSAEMALGLDNYTERCIKPAVNTLISGIEADFIAAMTKKTFNTVGTAGVVPGASNDTTVIGLARAKLNQEGFISRNATADFYENERIWTLANPADVAGEIDESTETNFTEGTTTVHMDGLTTASDIVAGMVFVWEGLYAVHPETKQVYAHLQDFVVVSVANPSSGDADITFSPAIYTTGAKQNVKTQIGGTVTWTSTGQDGKDITFRGSASASYKYGLMYHKDAFTFATADLPLMTTGECSRKVYEGLAIRLWKSGDIVNDRELLRLDILYGWKDLQAEWATRVILN
jgi:hypothetical protein